MLLVKGAEGSLCEPINLTLVHTKLQIPSLFCELIDHLNLAFIPYSTGETINLLHKGGEGSTNSNIQHTFPPCV